MNLIFSASTFPLTEETRHSISRREFALMKPTAFVINTARGNIIEEAALVEALRAGKLGGAGLDVFEHEPKVHPALIAMKNVVLLPHIGSADLRDSTAYGASRVGESSGCARWTDVLLI